LRAAALLGAILGIDGEAVAAQDFIDCQMAAIGPPHRLLGERKLVVTRSNLKRVAAILFGIVGWKNFAHCPVGFPEAAEGNAVDAAGKIEVDDGGGVCGAPTAEADAREEGVFERLLALFLSLLSFLSFFEDSSAAVACATSSGDAPNSRTFFLPSMVNSTDLALTTSTFAV